MDNDNKQVTFGEIENSQKMTISKGALLERRIQRLFFAMGYYTKNNIIIKSSQEFGADVITDLDVYGVYVHNNFTSKRLWADCKSGRAKPLERISWLKGIRSTIKIDDIIFVKSGVRTTTKQFAHRSGIMVLDEPMLTKLETDYGVDPTDWSGPWNPATQDDKIARLRSIDKSNRGICSRAADFISSTYWTLEEYARVKKCITAIRGLGESLQLCRDITERSVISWGIYQLVPMFTLATLNICRELYFLNDTEKYPIIKDGLISGEIPINKRAALIDATYKMAQGIIQQQYPTTKVPDLDLSLALKPPAYFKKFYDLVLRITSRPIQYYDVLRLLDYSLQEFSLNSKQPDENEMIKRFPSYENARFGEKTILHFILDVCDISQDVFGFLLIKK